MATGTAVQPLKIPPEGRLGARPLETLLGPLGLLGATCLLEISHKKLLRRFVLEGGRLVALVSNAREDRLLDWAIEKQLLDLSADKIEALITDCGGSPLTGFQLLRHDVMTVERLAELQAQYLTALLTESSSWNDATYKITPGRVQLGGEPLASLPALKLGFELAQSKIAAAKRPPPLPTSVSAFAGWEAWRESIDADAAALLSRAQESARSQQLTTTAEGNSDQLERLVAALVRVGLLIEWQAPKQAESDLAERSHELTEAELQAWLLAAEQENLELLLGVPVGADPALVRKGYYQTVRLFHPDRFRSGPLAQYLPRVEHAFRLVHEAQEVLTSSAARSAWEKRRQAPVRTEPDHAKVVKSLDNKARAALQAGRRSEAVEFYERLLGTQGHEPQHELALWMLLLGNPKRRAEAIGKIRELSVQHPARVDILAGLVIAFRKAGREEDAQLALKRIGSAGGSELIVMALNRDRVALAKLKLDPLWGAVLD